MPAYSSSVYHIKPSQSPGSSGSSSSKTHKLVLTTTSLRNVVLANASDVLYYEVLTPLWERHRTCVSRLDVKTRGFDLIAELLNGHAPGDTRGHEDDAKRVMALRMYGGGEFRAVDEFLHLEVAEGSESEASTSTSTSVKGKERAKDTDEEELLGGFKAWFRGKDGKKYTWFADQKRLELMSDDRPGKPVAAFHKEKRYLNVLRMAQHPYLEVDPSTIEILDSLVISFLLVERLRRERTGQ